ncbi:Pex12 amino terminal region-domain-containing protein [Piptocephalis cylindrospora]|uniref:RING-type E3 ubiquitin transferase (cysteine targeting) n=1 Tax=Piptocephalis cylindrospora TaxID=1907219 RepID=A0A4P9Y969_9FUNG|nr:Pex12 amino terminal region-domain-containing protein [Piptocephalis cylindrospora]|eukprot:RKP15342.1 Pex12 amino terminal region-domain-containing protein [Piptocephalis cylindrospora]
MPMPFPESSSPAWPWYLSRYQKAVARLSSLQPPSNRSLTVARVSQMDAHVLDVELEDVVYGQVSHSLRYFESIKDKYEAEMKTVVRFLLYSLSFFSPERHGGPVGTYGSDMQNLRLASGPLYLPTQRPSNARLWAWVGAHSMGPYLIHRVERAIGARGWSDMPMVGLGAFPRPVYIEIDMTMDSLKYKVWKMVQHAERLWKTASLLHFILFLWHGRFRSIPERILGLRWVWARRQSTRGVSFEFLNRQLVWHAFTEFLMFLVPLVDLGRFRTNLRQLLSRRQSPSQYADLPKDICAICLEEGEEELTGPSGAGTPEGQSLTIAQCRITLPYVTDCNHLYCHYCVVARRGTIGWACPRCGHTVEHVERLGASSGKEAEENEDEKKTVMD